MLYITCQGNFTGIYALPDQHSLFPFRKGEVYRKMHPSGKCLVHIFTQVGCQNDDPFMFFHLLEQIIDLDIRVAVVRVLHLRPFSKERVRLVKDYDGVACLSFLENFTQVLFCFTYLFTDNGRQIYLIQIKLLESAMECK